MSLNCHDERAPVTQTGKRATVQKPTALFWWNLAGKSWTWQHWVRPYPPALASDESESNGRGADGRRHLCWGRQQPAWAASGSGSNGENRFRGTWEWQHPIPYTPTMVLEPYGSQHTRRQVVWDPLANCPKRLRGRQRCLYMHVWRVRRL